MKCKYCGKEMSLDDVDYRFDGCQDNYWLCNNCYASANEMIRYGKSIKVEFIKMTIWRKIRCQKKQMY